MLAPSEDQFWNVNDREQEEERRLRNDVASLEAAIDLHRRIAAMRNSAGFSEFLKSLQGLRTAAAAKLIGDDRYTNDGLREQRGRVRALDDVILLVTREQVGLSLAEQLVERKNLLAEALRRRPKPKQEVSE